jgi:mannose-1-phosphate guanylyltransferase
MENPISDQINAGCYIFRRSVIDEIPSGQVVSVERETFPSLLASGRRVQGFIDQGYWRDIGTPSALIAASADLITGRFRSPATPTPNSTSGSGYIAPTAEVSENVIVSEGSVILDGAKIGENSIIAGSIIGEKAVIDAGSVIRTSFVAPRSQIARIDVEGEILGF